MITIRKLTATDAPAYRRARLYCLQTFPGNFGSLYEDELNKKKLFFEECLENPGCDSFIYGAFSPEGECVGLCGFVPEKRTRTKHRGEIIQMFVHEKYQRNNIGEKLLQSVITEALVSLQIEQITLGVVSENIAAITLYKKLGFKEYGMLENYFKLPDKYIHQRFFVLANS
jgi:ribosomal protein S18 acetylase RimI-like enzyme